MSDILKFPQRRGATASQEFLQDGDDNLCFDAWEKKTNSEPVKFKEPHFLGLEQLQRRNWSNQELADLYRVKRLLDSAGVPNEIDRGVTDEGDPWFLFCDVNGEVFIHLCRIDGIYILDSPNVSHPLRGRDFSDLIAEFSKRNLPANGGTSSESGPRVVQLQRNGKVFLHPSSMLAALIWTLFLASEELSIVVPDENHRTIDFSDKPEHKLSADDKATEIQHDFWEAESTVDFEKSRQEHIADALAPHLRSQSYCSETKSGLNNYAIGLSVIAISLGFMSEKLTLQAVDMEWVDLVAQLTGRYDVQQNGGSQLAHLVIDDSISLDLFAMINMVFDDLSSVVKVHGEALVSHMGAFSKKGVAFADEFDPLLLQDIKSALAAIGKDLALTFEQAAIGSEVGMSEADESDGGVGASELPGSPAMVDGVEETNLLLSRLSLADDAAPLLRDIREFIINDSEVHATFDIDQEALSTAKGLVASFKSEALDSVSFLGDDKVHVVSDTEREYLSYDERAQEFIEFVISKDTDLEMISTGREVIFFDPSVLVKNAGDSFVLSWALENGDVVSMIGLQSDYQAFDLIA